MYWAARDTKVYQPKQLITEWSSQHLETFWECNHFLKGEFMAVAVVCSVWFMSNLRFFRAADRLDIYSYFQTYNLALSEKYLGLIKWMPFRYSVFLFLSCAVDPRPYLPPHSRIPFSLIVRSKSKVFSGDVLLLLQGDKPLMVAFVPVCLFSNTLK